MQEALRSGGPGPPLSGDWMQVLGICANPNGVEGKRRLRLSCSCIHTGCSIIDLYILLLSMHDLP